MLEAVPELQRLVVGIPATLLPLAEPQAPLPPAPPVPAKGAVQVPELPPPLVPSQTQVHGPLPLTFAGGTPVLHKFVVGALLTATALALPHVPLTARGCTGAEQLILPPPLLPMQVQFHNVVPVSVTPAGDTPPEPHKFVAGALNDSTPLALPQVPLTGVATDVEITRPVKVVIALDILTLLPTESLTVPLLRLKAVMAKLAALCPAPTL
jgi:hypothetical protein